MKQRAGILALDLATNVGFSQERPGRDPLIGSVSLRTMASHPGAKACVYIDWLAAFMQVHMPERIIYEAPMMIQPEKDGKRGGNTQTMVMLIGLCYVTEMMACRWDVPVVKAAVSTARKFFVGSGNAKKEDAMAECLRRGWNPPDTDASDAACLLDYAVHEYHPKEYRWFDTATK